MQNLGNELFLDLANILKGEQVSKENIQQALKLICNGFSFDCGLIYETDFSSRFYLIENYGLDITSDKEQGSVDFLTPEEKINLVEKPITSIERKTNNTPLELKLLNMYNAESLVITPIKDEELGVYGALMLLNTSHKSTFAKVDLNLVYVALYLLARYAQVKMYQKEIRQTQATLESVLDNAGVDIYVNDFYNHDILYTNESMAAPYGGKEQFLNKKCWQVLFPMQNGPCEFCPQKNLIDENGKPTKIYSWDYQRAFDGSWFRVFSAAFHWVDGRLAHVVSSANITDNKRNEALIERLANYDELTKLPNRRSLIKECECRISKATESERGYLLFFDIDGFKKINDSYGHDAGDEFLIQLGEFFTDIPMLKDAIYRNGGDEFVAILSGETITKEHIKHLASFIYARFSKAWKLKSGEVFCNVSIGVACYPEDGTTPQELLQKADKAMYYVKKKGGGGLCFGYQLPI